MKTAIDRVLLVQPEGELANYTMSLLDEMGFRHVVHAADVPQAERLWKNSLEKQRPFQLVVCDDEVSGGGLSFFDLVSPIPMVVFSHATNPQNLRLAAKIGISNLVFRPYGRTQLEYALKAVLKF
jgi:DNA-binding NarL/FixJ family response regulator